MPSGTEARKEKWLTAGLEAFARNGLDSLNIDDLAREIGTAKTSFYHFFGSKKEFFESLCDYWEYVGTDSYIHDLEKIYDPYKRFRRLRKLINDSPVVEYFFLQLKSLSLKNETARSYLDRVQEKRVGVASKIFMDMGFSKKKAIRATELFIVLEFGEIVLSNGKDLRSDFNLRDKEILALLGVENVNRKK